MLNFYIIIFYMEKKWIFFTSDLHLGSNQVLKNDNRPFKNANTFKKFIIKTWNKQTSKNDTIYVIGDLFDCHSQTKNDLETQIKFVKKNKSKNNFNYWK